jgi:hypothetical protein
MTYTFKLARRLAVSRNFGMLPVLLLFAGCAGGDATSPDNSPVDVPGSGIYAWRPRESTPVALLVSPSTVIVETNQLLQFRARGRNRAGDEVVAPVSWSTTGGTILPDGRFSAASIGSYQVSGSARTSEGTNMVQTSTITVVRRQAKVKSVVVTPGRTTLNPGVSQTFAAIGRLPGGDTVPIGVTWSAKGGTIDAGGLYVAGDTVGTFQVIATKSASTLADTATITISAPPAPVPPSDSAWVPPAPDTTPTPTAPPPAPVLAQVTLLPASATLAPGTTKQFTAYGRTTAGDSLAVSVVFAATGGTVTPAGLYTAGPSAGSFRVIATVAGLADTSTVTVTVPLGSGTSVGVPFGPYGLWASSTALNGNAGPFGTSLNYSDASTIVAQIDAARTKGQKLIINMTACCRSEYLTNGSFDLAKWKLRQDRFNTAAIKAAIAAGVQDGTVIGAKLLDEPEHAAWGTTVSKTVVDQMAAYTKNYFPTLPVGVSHGPPGYRWRTDQTYKLIDWISYQYNWAVSGVGFAQGDAAGWRNAVLTQAAKDGVAPSFSINLLDGGTRVTGCPVPETGGTGTFSINCRMTAAQVESFGKTLGPVGCAFLMWRYDDSFMANTGNQAAFRAIADSLSRVSRKSCRRP